ncbi:hypothetical protein SAMN02745248_01340 [Hathewaya proteolytica DSM 3090]|uniref:Uncharacterized protein n=1 Tax=Hathewaya proteolytica DSM 3090 TaxID=1121331 RepID=A0A1M6NAM1_9CLOT|nr:hypothetical protein [Hathewaya proteolytica]SHJ92576.1 hypothetical protein SAMN02745248_01340 [Hathewaya proteolytica DSM 3090]
MDIIYPERMQLFMQSEDGEEVIGYAQRYMDVQDEQYRCCNNVERDYIDSLLKKIDNDYVDMVLKKQ